MAGITRRIAMSPIPTTIQLSIAENLSKPNVGRALSPANSVHEARPRHTCPTQKTKGRPKPAFEIHLKQKLRFLGSDRILGGLGDAELHHGLGLDLDRFAGLRIASHAGFTVRLHQAAQSRHDEHAVLLRLFDGGIGQVLQERRRLLVVEFILLRQKADELRFSQTRCHVIPPRKKCDVIPLAAILLPQPCGKTPDFTRVWQMWYVGEALFTRPSMDSGSKTDIQSVFADENQLRIHPGVSETQRKTKPTIGRMRPLLAG